MSERDEIADELRQIADMGLTYSTDPYDRERFTRIAALSARLAAADGGGSAEAVLAGYGAGYAHLSPLIGADAVVVVEARILLIRRADNGLWALPGGLAEVGESIPRAAERELLEEAGVAGMARRLLGAWDSRVIGSGTRMQMLQVAFLIEPIGKVLARPDGKETLDAQFFGADDLPPLSPGHTVVVPYVLKAAQDPAAPAWFDR